MKLHLGCDKRNFNLELDGWFHMDEKPWCHLDKIGDVRDLSFIKSNTVEVIYACHVFEYFSNPEEVLAEWYRVLKPAGTLRLAVPNFEALCKVYRKNGNIKEVLGPLYGHWCVVNNDKGEKKFIQHHTCYDSSSLSELLAKCHFEQIEFWDWRTTEHAKIDDYSQAYIPHMDKENGILISLNMEAKKPETQ